MRRRWLGPVATVLLLLCSIPATAAPPQLNVTTHGGNPLHTNFYPQAALPSLCAEWVKDLPGSSFTQPLLVGEDIFFLNGNALYRFSLTGQQLGVMRWPKGTSKGQMTYYQAGPTLDPDADWLFVPTPGPDYGVIALHPSEITGDATPPSGRTEFTKVPNQPKLNGQYYIVTAPLYFPQTDTLVFGTVDENNSENGHVQAVWNLTNDKPIHDDLTGNGWISGSPLRVGENRLLIGVTGGVSLFEVTPSTLQAITRFTTGASVISSIVGENGVTEYPTVALGDDSAGNIFKLDLVNNRMQWSQPPPFRGFSNSEPAVDDTYLYLPMRWPIAAGTSRDDQSVSPLDYTGAVAAYKKATGELAWVKRFDSEIATEARPTWVNQPPIVVGGSPGVGGRVAPKKVLVGDAGGRVMALDAAGEPAFLMMSDGADHPLSCSDVESTTWDAPRVMHSAVASLADSPWVSRGEYVWSNRSGIGSGMVFARERLITAANSSDGTSRLVVLRAGTNIKIEGIALEQNGQPLAPTEIDPTHPFTAAVTVGWHVPGTGRQLSNVPVMFGWADAAPEVQYVSAPTGDGEYTLRFTIAPRADGHHSGRLMALANPGFYDRRRAAEEQDQVPAAWREAVAGFRSADRLSGLGEAEVWDTPSQLDVGLVGAPEVNLTVPDSVCAGDTVDYQIDYFDPQGLPQIAWEPAHWPPQPIYYTPGDVTIRYRAKNLAGAWSPWTEKVLTVRDCTDRQPPDQWFEVAFDPPTGHRGHQMQAIIQVLQPARIDGHDVESFTVDWLELHLPLDLKYLRACTDYACWDAPNDNPHVAVNGLTGSYAFELPAPSYLPRDGKYLLTVSGAGAYTYQEWKPNWEWVPHIVEEKVTDSRTGITTTQLVDRGWEEDHGQFVPKTGTWEASEEEPFEILGGHEYVHPITDYDN